jgi:hypothetical protein
MLSLLQKIKKYFKSEGELEILDSEKQLEKYIRKKKPSSVIIFRDFDKKGFNNIKEYFEILVKDYHLPIFLYPKPTKDVYLLFSNNRLSEPYHGHILIENIDYMGFSISNKEPKKLARTLYSSLKRL